ncbi:hypothetical protein [Methanomethylovorans sp.]|uniref:hypothetical protein n=1 Tax=Methanomethylovorans sp. TaxID=2758717 RepID=UPI00345EBCEE
MSSAPDWSKDTNKLTELTEMLTEQEEKNKSNDDLKKLVDSIESVTIYEGRVKNDQKTWKIKLAGVDTPLSVDAEALTTPRVFSQQHLKWTNSPAPHFKPGKWNVFVAYLSERAEQKQTESESEEVYIAETVYEALMELDAINPEHIKKKKGYIPIDGYRGIQHYTLKEITEGLGFKYNSKVLSDTLTQLGYKKEETSLKWIQGLKRPVRVWLFYEPKVQTGTDCKKT